jgi:cytidylate kinase
MAADEAVGGYLDFITYESKHLRESLARPPGSHQPVITVSRQAGAGAKVVAAELAIRLQARGEPGASPWTVFDRNLIDRVLKEHRLPERLAEFMPEDRLSGIADTVDQLLGMHPPSWVLVRKTADTILHLAELGNVILIGRGANVVTSRLRYAFHVRLVGSVERRIEHVQDYLHLDPRAASEYVRREDLGRRRYLKKYYGRAIDDPLQYHLVINTDRLPYAEAAAVIADAARTHQHGPGEAPRPTNVR